MSAMARGRHLAPGMARSKKQTSVQTKASAKAGVTPAVSKNGGMSRKASRRQNAGPATSVISARSSYETVPAAIAPVNGSLQSHFTWKGDAAKVGGVETRVASFRQMLSPLQLSSMNAGLFPMAADQPYAVKSRIPLAPLFVGGNVYKQSSAYRLWKFDDIKLEYIPTVPTTTQHGVCIGYDPGIYPSAQTSTISESGNLGTLFNGMLNLATVAAGPTWGPLVATGAGLARAGVEKALSWFQNRKITSSYNQILQILQDDVVRADDLDTYLTALSAHVTALDTATSITGNPAYTVGPLFGDPLALAYRLADTVHQIRGSLNSEILACTQGHIDATADTYLPGSGVYERIGFLMISGVVTFSDPITTDDSSLLVGSFYGDPMDTDHPETAPYHQSWNPGVRARYLDIELDSLLPASFHSLIEAHGIPSLRGPLGAVTKIEIFVSAQRELNKLTSRANYLLNQVKPLKEKQPAAEQRAVVAAPSRPSTVPAAYGGWVDVKKVTDILQAMREGVALSN